MLTFKHEAPCVAALAIAIFAGAAGMSGTGSDARHAPIAAAHDKGYFQCVRYSKNAVQTCRADTRRNNQPTRGCSILYRSYMQMCQAA